MAVRRFALLSSVALVILGAGTAVLSGYLAKSEAIRDARVRSELIARATAAPMLDEAVRRQDPRVFRQLSTALQNRIRYGSVRHIVLWSADGRIIWADERQFIGARIALSAELRELARRSGSIVYEPGEKPPHPGRDPDEDSLLEVYVGATDADGVPFLFEAYISPERVNEDARAVLRQILPMSLGALLVLQLATLPLAVSLARRVDRTTAHRTAILQRSLMSWHQERRRLAQDLHDGVVQDLSAMSYALPGVIDQLPDRPEAEMARATAERMCDVLVRDLAALRSMVIDLAPSELDGRGLVTALEELSSRSTRQGLDVDLSVDPALSVGETVGGLVYRVVREGLRNVEKHAQAQNVEIAVSRRGDLVEVRVSDDGRGHGEDSDRGRADDGHVGLRLLGQFVRDVGGTLWLDGRPGGGTELRASVPLDPPEPGADRA